MHENLDLANVHHRVDRRDGVRSIHDRGEVILLDYTMSQEQIRDGKYAIWWMHKVIKYDMMFRKLRR